MKFTSAILSLAVAAGVFAAPVEERDSSASIFTPKPLKGCLCESEAAAIVNAFKYLLANPTAGNFETTANSLLAVNFVDTSDSINQLVNDPTTNPIGGPTFVGREAFIKGSGSQPPLLTATDDFFWSCNKISWRWHTTGGVGDDDESIKGIDNFYINSKGRISNVYAEFNSLGFSKNLGYPGVCSNTKRSLGRSIAI